MLSGLTDRLNWVRKVTLSTATLLVLLAASARAEASGETSIPDVCRRTVVHDWSAPLKAMRSLHSLPSSGHPRFFPVGTRIEYPEDPVLVPTDPGGTDFGFTFRSESHNGRYLRLGWQIALVTARVNNNGETLKVLSSYQRRLGSVSEAAFNRLSLHAMLPHHEGFYRLSLVFRRQDGSVLGRYGKYLRILRPKASVDLVARPLTVSGGSAIYLQVVNTGTSHISFGEPFTIERYLDSGWTLAPVAVGPWHRIRLGLDGGMAGRCQRFIVPEGMSTGLYRFSKAIATPSMNASAAFEVVP